MSVPVQPVPRIAVIGGGPAGLMAADVVSAAGIGVTVYERLPTVGRKLLMAGRGGLNLTHSEPSEAFLDRYGPARAWLEPMIRAYPPERLVAFAHELGQPTFTGSSGRVFPRAMKASPLLRAWLARLGGRGVGLATGHRWTGMDADGHLAFETAGGTARATADAVVLALGGGSWARLGSDGAWTTTVARWGVEVAPLTAANCGVGIAWSEHMRRHVGAPLKRIAVTAGGRRVRGEAVVTAGGLEGGAVYALTRELRHALAGVDGSQAAAIDIDLRPDETEATLAARLARPRGKLSTATFLARTIDLAPVARALLHECAGRELPADPACLAALIKRVRLDIRGLAGLERAISSAGGVMPGEVDADLMLQRRPGVFVAGEMLDWEAPTGGYLLQACFATGHRAGTGAVAWLADVGRRQVGDDRDRGGAAATPISG